MRSSGFYPKCDQALELDYTTEPICFCCTLPHDLCLPLARGSCWSFCFFGPVRGLGIVVAWTANALLPQHRTGGTVTKSHQI